MGVQHGSMNLPKEKSFASGTNHNETRCNKAIDEMIKIQDSGKGNDGVQRILDMLNSLKIDFMMED